jgi:hypothetical protein
MIISKWGFAILEREGDGLCMRLQRYSDAALLLDLLYIYHFTMDFYASARHEI